MAFGILAMLISCATTQNQYSIQEMVEKKDYAALRNLMFDESVNVNDLASYGETALAIAVKNNYRDIMEQIRILPIQTVKRRFFTLSAPIISN